MKEDLSAANGTMPENEGVAGGLGTSSEEAKAASGGMSAFQGKMDRWFDGIGRGAVRGIIGSLVIGYVLMFGACIKDYFECKPPIAEFLVGLGKVAIAVPLFFLPVGVVIGGLLGAFGLFPEKKKTSEPKKTEKPETMQSGEENVMPDGSSMQ